MAAERITGPLRAWYDIHDALRQEIGSLEQVVTECDEDDRDAWTAFADRFEFFHGELRDHSLHEDGIVFPAMRQQGIPVESNYTKEHHKEQALVYDVAASIHEVAVLTDRYDVSGARQAAREAIVSLRMHLVEHLALEEEYLLPQADEVISDDEQAWILQAIIASVPPDPRVQPWIAAALTPEHREARLVHMHDELPADAFAAVMGQIRAGVSAEIWADIVSRQPGLAAAAGLV